MATWGNQDVTDEHIIPYISADDAEGDVKAALHTLPFERNVFKLLANAPTFFPTFMKLLSCCWSADRTLRASDWQTVVLRTAATLDAPYEWDVNAPVARILGFTPAQLAALRDTTTFSLPADLFTPRQRLIVRFVDEVNAHPRVSPGLMDELKRTFGDRGVMELFYTNGVYAFLARMMNSCRIDYDPPIPGLEDMLRGFNAAAIEREKGYTD